MIELDSIVSQWVRVGAKLGSAPAKRSPDIERLIVRSASVMQDMPRLHRMMIAWLIRYGELTSRHRLAELARKITSPLTSATLGFTLARTKRVTHSDHFNLAISACQPLPRPQPLFEAFQRSSAMVAFAEETTCPLALEWGLWAPEEKDLSVHLYHDAIRPTKWIMKNNPPLKIRALFSGKLQASILVTLQADPATGKSESALARAVGATRVAIRKALAHLELCQLIERKRGKYTTAITIIPHPSLGLM